MSEYIKSPINYTGCKYTLLTQLMTYIPKDIDTFYDVFGGGATVSLNINAKQIVCNDYIPHIMNLLDSWHNVTDIEDYISQLDDIDVHTESEFKALRTQYNKSKDLNELFILISNSYNGQMRFNNKGEYNSSYAKGIRYFNENIKNNIRLAIPIIQNKDIKFITKDFRDIDYNSLTNKDFVYLDPPYSISCGVYQDGKRGFKGWNKADDKDLFNICDILNRNGIKFLMSNLFSSKGIENTELKEWSKKYNVEYLNANYNIGARKTLTFKDEEVVIKNY